VESGEGLLDASRVVQGDARGAQPGDAERHRDAVVAAAGDVRRIGPGRVDLDPVAAHLDRDAGGAEVLRATPSASLMLISLDVLAAASPLEEDKSMRREAEHWDEGSVGLQGEALSRFVTELGKAAHAGWGTTARLVVLLMVASRARGTPGGQQVSAVRASLCCEKLQSSTRRKAGPKSEGREYPLIWA
jgi:hypothetical protein